MDDDIVTIDGDSVTMNDYIVTMNGDSVTMNGGSVLLNYDIVTTDGDSVLLNYDIVRLKGGKAGPDSGILLVNSGGWRLPYSFRGLRLPPSRHLKRRPVFWGA